LGFVSFYHRFIKNVSGIARPIIDLTRNKGLNFHWEPLQVIAFQQHKDLFTSTLMLKYFDSSKEIITDSDANNFAIDYILSQRHMRSNYILSHTTPGRWSLSNETMTYIIKHT
jgi:hypothetical protein